MLKNSFPFLIILFLFSCTHNTISVENEHKGNLVATHELKIQENNDKMFYLDSETAPYPPYVQLIKDSLNQQILSFLNPYNTSIYFYNYNDTSFIKRIKYEKEGANAILKPAGFYIHNMDSIYVYNMPMTEIVLCDSFGIVKNRISLRSSDPNWPLYMPQYLLSTTNPIMESDNNLILTGQSFFSIPEENISKFRFSVSINMETNTTSFHHTYPDELYGINSNWEGGLPTQVFSAKLNDSMVVYSFPVSHNLYISNYNSSDYQTAYGGSNQATTIKSIDREAKNTPDEIVVSHYLQQDMYGPIIYDRFRNLYYRFLFKGVPNASFSTPKEEKPIIIIIMDKNLEYLGETFIGNGKEWNWNNSFVSEEGLNIEYIDNEMNEDYLIFKVFSVKPIVK